MGEAASLFFLHKIVAASFTVNFVFLGVKYFEDLRTKTAIPMVMGMGRHPPPKLGENFPDFPDFVPRLLDSWHLVIIDRS